MTTTTRLRTGYPIALAAALTAALLAPADAAAEAAADAAAAAAAIAAHHKELDDELAGAQMSPFTAIAAHYLEAGQKLRLGADRERIQVDPPQPKEHGIVVSFAEGSLFAEPMEGAGRPSIRKYAENGDAGPGPGTPVSARVKIGDDEIAALGRFLLEFSPQSGYARVIAYDPESPERKAFKGLKWFDPNPGLQVKASFRPNPAPEKVTVGTSRGLKKEYYRVGTFEFSVDGTAQKLTALAVSGTPKEGDSLFVPFRDATTGKESYDVGRYLSMKYAGAGAAYTIDFNRATNPNCNYSPHYNCPIPPKENTLTVAIRAGEMTYPKAH